MPLSVLLFLKTRVASVGRRIGVTHIFVATVALTWMKHHRSLPKSARSAISAIRVNSLITKICCWLHKDSVSRFCHHAHLAYSPLPMACALAYRPRMENWPEDNWQANWW